LTLRKHAFSIAGLVGVLAILAGAVAIFSTGPTASVRADGAGSPAECLSSNPLVYNVSSETEGQSQDLVTFTAPAGFVVEAVCIKSGVTLGHTGPLGNGTYDGDGNAVADDDPDACYVVSGVGTTTATVTRVGGGRDCQGISHVDFITVEAPAGELSVEKTATLAYDRVCEWDVEKEADTERIVLGAGESADINYTVTVTAECEDGVDGEGTVSGTITIENVGGLPVEDIVVVDTLNGNVIDVDCGDFDGTLDPGESVECTYSESQPIGDGSNHVAVSGTDTAGNETDDEFTAEYTDDGPANVVLGCVLLSDTHPEAALSDELLCVDGDGNFEPAVYNYTVTVQTDPDECTSFNVNNTATIVDEDGNTVDDSSVTVAVVCRQEWCSPGYWRNHLDEAAVAAAAGEFQLTDTYASHFGAAPPRTRQGVRQNAPTNPSLLQVLQNPQWYGGDAFNNVGDLLSDAHPDVDFSGERVEDSCPLN
jgi:hypothetical protein